MYNLFIKHKKTFLLLNIITLFFLLCNKTIVSADNISDKPEIISVTTSTNSTSHGTDIHTIVRAKSNSPVNWINKSFMQPDGQYVYGGGHGAIFFEISPGIWEYQWTDTVSKYAPSGTYTYMDISVKNEGLLQSDSWANNIEIPIKNIIDPKKPEIISVTTSTNITSHGTDIHNIIRVKSNSPVNRIYKRLMQPNGQYVYGGEDGATFYEISPGIWEYQWTDTVSKYAPSGTYTYMDISVKNEGLLQSDSWANNIEIPIKNIIDPKKPEIISVTTSTNITSHGTDIHNIIRVKSNSPVNRIYKRLMQPNGQYVYGGEDGATFYEISPGIWEYQWTDTVSKYLPSGTYTYENISVRNEGLLQSDEWATIELNISNSKSEDIFPDGVIDIKDLSLLALYYNCTSTDITWKPEYDFNNDLIIDIYDLVYIATKFN